MPASLAHVSSQYVFSMYRLSRVHPPDKEVLKDISVSMIPGAKIGVIGPNGAGKSTLLRIMAGRDTEFRGEAQLAPSATVGLLEQEPELDEGKDVRGNVEEGLAGPLDLSMPRVRAMLSAAVAAGWLRTEGENRGRRYLAGPRLAPVPLRTPGVMERLRRGTPVDVA